MNHNVFITYHNHDIEIAKTICHALEQNEIKCWMAPRDVPPRSYFGDVMDEAIKSCEVVVVLFSKNAAESQWMKNELTISFEELKNIIVFALDQTPIKDQYRFMLKKALWIDAFPDYRTKLNELVLSVSRSTGKEVLLEKTDIKSSMKRKYNKLFIIGIVLLIIGVFGLLYLFFA